MSKVCENRQLGHQSTTNRTDATKGRYTRVKSLGFHPPQTRGSIVEIDFDMVKHPADATSLVSTIACSVSGSIGLYTATLGLLPTPALYREPVPGNQRQKSKHTNLGTRPKKRNEMRRTKMVTTETISRSWDDSMGRARYSIRFEGLMREGRKGLERSRIGRTKRCKSGEVKQLYITFCGKMSSFGTSKSEVVGRHAHQDQDWSFNSFRVYLRFNYQRNISKILRFNDLDFRGRHFGFFFVINFSFVKRCHGEGKRGKRFQSTSMSKRF